MTGTRAPDYDRRLHPEALTKAEDFKQRGVQWQPPIHAEGVCPSCDAFRLMGGESAPGADLREQRVRLRAALEELLDVAERHRGGDPNLSSEAWYAARDYAKVVLRDTE